MVVLETKADEKILFSVVCQYDGNGNRVEKKGIQCLAGDETVPIHTTYQYDIRGQLLEENRQGEPVGVIFRYGYDACGNRTSKEENSRRTIYLYNRKNQLAIEESDQEKIRFTYNQQGSMISREGRLESEGFSITAKTNRYEQRRKMARYKKTDTMQKDCVMKSEKTKTVSGLCIIRESCCMRKGERRAAITWEMERRQFGGQKKLTIITRMSSLVQLLLRMRSGEPELLSV